MASLLGETTGVKNKYIQALLQEGMNTTPIQSPWQGASRLAHALLAGLEIRDEDKNSREALPAILSALGGGQAAPTQPTQPAPEPTTLVGNNPNYGSAIASIESGGKYDALGPVTKTGDRAHGKYQVMGANIGPWSQEALGRKLTPQEFMADPKAQDAVFNHRFGQYAQKYGPEGAARAWFAGEGGMNDPNRKDQLGTSVAQYGQKFTQAMGGQPQPAPSAPPVQQGMGDQLGQLKQLANHPNPKVREFAAGLAQQVISNSFKPQTTDEIKEYNLYRQQGGKDSFYDYKTGMKRAGAIQNTVQIDQKGETAFSTEAGKIQAKRFGEIAEEGQSAKQMQSDISMLRDLGEQIRTGKLAEVKAAIGPYAEALGIKVDGLSEIQAFEAVVNRVAPQMRVKGTGAQSDFELRNFLKQFPSIGNNPEGNAIIDATLQGFVQNKIAASEISSKALSKEITPAQADKMLRELPDPMKAWREFQKTMKSSGASGAQSLDDLLKKYGPK